MYTVKIYGFFKDSTRGRALQVDIEQIYIEAAAKKVAECIVDLKEYRLESKGDGYFDSLFPLHVNRIYKVILEKKNQLKLKTLSFPLANPWVEKLINGREKRDIGKAIIEALLTILRQEVGSCFATAPVLYVQTADPQFLFDELYDLVTRGHLRRVIDGKEYRVPMSIKGSTLLRCYEYTVASFADWKVEFYKWNMYTSLGLDVHEVGGIGEVVYRFLEAQVEKLNVEMQKLTEEVYHAEDRYRSVEVLFRNAKGIDEARRLESEAKMNAHHYFASKDLLEAKQAKGEIVDKFYPHFQQELFRLFPLYFQEVFDPEMQGEASDILEDRPAGFRLVFKHGRQDPTQWTMIYNEKEYIQCLIEFFKLAEIDMGYTAPDKKLLESVIDQAIFAISERGFLEKATKRIQTMHLKHLQGPKTLHPWAYISGGNLESLCTIYFSLKNPMTRKDFVFKSAYQLVVDLVEYMKEMPYREAKTFEDNPWKGILMTNSHHALLFRPGLKPFFDAWQHSGNTYTYVRDHVGPLPFADTNWGSEVFALYGGRLVRQGTFEVKELPRGWEKGTWTLWGV